MLILSLIVLIGLLLLSKQAPIWLWTLVYGVGAGLILRFTVLGIFGYFLLLSVFLGLLFCSIKPLRTRYISAKLMKSISTKMPIMSMTEREALAAGTVTWEGDLLSGAPDFKKLLALPAIQFSEQENAFMQGPLLVLCRMIDDWDVTHNYTDLPPDMWQFIKENGFFGMIIPKQYGGLDFSAGAQAAILATLYGRSISVATTISVPNSLGPAELLLKYGTTEQKDYYLPRLADGREIPCFALTGPNAGSDAASIPDVGVVCRRKVGEEEVLGVRLNWDKRYITLCPIATLIGLAFRLMDPENLLGRGHDLGITCALIPADMPGVSHGRRHFPLNTAFLNGPTRGKDVFITFDHIIGGKAMMGAGWRMLMECLSAGRAVSLPSSALGGSQAAVLASGAYARVRKQFNMAIHKFEGIEEPLARIVGNAYIIDSGVQLTTESIAQGAKPAIAGAILKVHTTERGRQIICDAMDIHGGKGICLGPKNYLGRGYQNAPISITVEGANILTRTLIIFGQGIIRCHPYVYAELESIRTHNQKAFDHAFFGHIGFVCANLTKSVLFNVTQGYFIRTPTSSMKRYYQLIHLYSTYLAFLADYCLISLGAHLKRKEKISARLGDMLSTLYLASAVLKRYHNDQEDAADRPIVEWCCQQLLYDCDQAMRETIRNLPRGVGRVFLKCVLRPLGRQVRPTDALGQQVASLITEPNSTRARLTRYVFRESLDNCPLGKLEAAFHLICAADALERKISMAVKEKLLHSFHDAERIEEALALGLLNESEAIQLREAECARQYVIAVDDFSDEELRREGFAGLSRPAVLTERVSSQQNPEMQYNNHDDLC